MVEPKNTGERIVRLETKVEQLEQDRDRIVARLNRMIFSLLTLAWSVIMGIFVWLVKGLAGK